MTALLYTVSLLCLSVFNKIAPDDSVGSDFLSMYHFSIFKAKQFVG